MAGFVYILSNPSFDGRIKIGKSSKDPSLGRVDELSAETSAPEPFKLEYYCFIDQYDELERLVHLELKDIRPNPKREFFTIDKEAAVKVLQSLAQECGGVKFEEYFFEIHANEYSEERIVNVNENSDDISGSYSNLLHDFPKAKLALEYNEKAALMLTQLKNCPEDVAAEFYSALEESPDLNDRELEKLFDNNFRKYLKPFENYMHNFRYAFCLKNSAEMAAEYLKVSKTLNSSVNNQQAFNKICRNFGITSEKMPSLEDEFFAYLNEELYGHIIFSDNQLGIIESFLEQFGVKVVKKYQSLHNVYQLFNNNSPISPPLKNSDLLEFLRGKFDPKNVLETYRGENILDMPNVFIRKKSNRPKKYLSKFDKYLENVSNTIIKFIVASFVLIVIARLILSHFFS